MERYLEKVKRCTFSIINRGTGFLISESGLAFTCKHVLNGEETGKLNLRCKLYNLNNRLDASVVYKDSSLDFAIIKINSEKNKFEYLDFESEKNIFHEVDEYPHVVMMGYPWKPKLQQDCSDGSLKDFNYMIEDINDQIFLLVDAEINKYWSGGPVFHTKSKIVIGMIKWQKLIDYKFDNKISIKKKMVTLAIPMGRIIESLSNLQTDNTFVLPIKDNIRSINLDYIQDYPSIIKEKIEAFEEEGVFQNLWSNPYYIFRLCKLNQKGEKYLELIQIDVTSSAWAQDISNDCKKTLGQLLNENSIYSINSVLDFGCGKFTSVNYILKHNKEIVVVDFKEIIERYIYLDIKLKEIHKNPLFKKMEFPKPFLIDKSCYDLVLLIHVLPIMPVFLERLITLSILHEKINRDKYLFWYAMKNPSIYRKRELTKIYSLGDGIWLGNKRFKTFYKYHEPSYVIFILYLSGFVLEKIFNVPATDALLFKRIKTNFLSKILNKINLEELIPCRMKNTANNEFIPKNNEEIEINPYPTEYDLYNIIRRVVLNIKSGEKSTDEDSYKRLCAGIIQYLFSIQLKNMKIDNPAKNGKNISFEIAGKSGFIVKNIAKIGLICMITRNISVKPSDFDVQQIFDQLADKEVKLVIFLCRKLIDRNAIIQIIKEKISGDYCIVLDDNNILKALKIRIEDGLEGINNFFRLKLNESIS